MNPLAYDQVTKVVVQTTDGKSWLCEYDSLGQIVPIRELGGDKPEPSEPTSEPSEPMGLAEPDPTATLEPAEAEGPGPVKGSGTIAQTFDEAVKGMLTDPFTPGTVWDETEVFEPDSSEPITMTDNVFRARLVSIMTDNMFDRNVRGRSRGKLDMRRLWKAQVGATNLFQQKTARKNKEYNIILLVDESGSMDGDNIRTAADIAVFLAQNFEGVNVNLAIVGFNEYIMVHKDFNEKIDYSALHETIVHNARNKGNGYNHDFDGLSKAYELLAGRKGQNFVIMMSDGAPATHQSLVKRVQEDPEELEQAIKDGAGWAVKDDYMGKRHNFWLAPSKLSGAQRDMKVNLNHLVMANASLADTIGIGIETDCWQVPNHIREDDIDHLKPVLLREIKKKIRRG